MIVWLLNNKWQSNVTAYLSVCYWPCPSPQDHRVPIFWWLLPTLHTPCHKAWKTLTGEHDNEHCTQNDKNVSSKFFQPSTNKVYLMKWPILFKIIRKLSKKVEEKKSRYWFFYLFSIYYIKRHFRISGKHIWLTNNNRDIFVSWMHYFSVNYCGWWRG